MMQAGLRALNWVVERKHLKLSLIVLVTMGVGGAATAGAASLISGSKIRKGSIPFNRLSKSTQKQIKAKNKVPASGVAGPKGDKGDKGDRGTDGANGTASYAGPHWGLIDRNTIGSPVGALRSGPFEGTGVGSAPPFGQGSLGLSVKDNTEKVSFGNEVDFAGNPMSGINQVGFQVFWTGEDKAIFADNLPNITFEVDPTGPSNATPPNYSSLVFVPTGTGVPINRWSAIDATNASAGKWYFTNSTTASTTGCTQAVMCDFATLKTAIATNYPSMSILTVAVAVGRNYAFNGAVDGLRINNEVFDFEPFGVTTRAP